jgi:ferric-chelate reductase
VHFDGPYGTPPSLSHNSTCVCFAGGSRVSYTLPLLTGLVRRVYLTQSIYENAVCCCLPKYEWAAVIQLALFVWIVHDRSQIDWISGEALQECPPTLELEIRIHVTQQTTPILPHCEIPPNAVTPEENSSSFEDEPAISLANFRSVKILNGRPEIDVLLDEELGCAVGRVSVNGGFQTMKR